MVCKVYQIQQIGKFLFGANLTASLPTPKVEKYEALFSYHEIFIGSSATSILSSRLRQINLPSTIQWEGPIQIAIRIYDEGNSQTSELSVSVLPGFQVTVTDLTFPQVSKLANYHARIRETAKRMPLLTGKENGNAERSE